MRRRDSTSIYTLAGRLRTLKMSAAESE
uniref:Uncharacterized protein n=1 Tax=Rhizophora mucronata TaxID=61149 RepID=A0A2P2IHJ4_RHIMU